MIIIAHLLAYGGAVAWIAIVLWAPGRESTSAHAQLVAALKRRGWSVPASVDWAANVPIRCGRIEVTLRLGHSSKCWARPLEPPGDDGAFAMQDLGDGLFLTKEHGALVMEDVRASDNAERWLHMIDRLLAECDARYQPAEEPAPGASPEQRFTRLTLIALAVSFALAIVLTLAGGPIRALQSRALCEPGVALTWVARRAERSMTEYSLACGADGEPIACFSAGLLVMHAIAIPLVAIAWLVTRRKRERPG